MDPASTLGLSTESIHGYSISHVKRVLDAEPPEMPPCRRGVNNIAVSLKGQSCSQGAGGGVEGGRGWSAGPPCVHSATMTEKLQYEPHPASVPHPWVQPRWKIFL